VRFQSSVQLGEVEQSATLRWLRASAVGGFALGVGLLAHLSAGGRLDGSSTVAGALAGAALVLGSHALLASQVTSTQILLLVVGGQAIVHAVLSISCASHLGSLVDQSIMFGLHALAAAFIAVWLAFGERALWAFMRAHGFRALQQWRAAISNLVPETDRAISSARQWLAGADDRRPEALLVGICPVRRGPPLAVA